MKKGIFIGLAILIFSLTSEFTFAAIVDTVVTQSKSMKKEIKAVVVKPQLYEGSAKRFPVLYLLHGAGGKYSDWLLNTKDKEAVKKLVDNFKIIVVCPDGGVTSWYFDSPIDPTYQYETYVSKELIDFIDGRYRTINDKTGRAITGLSMGGHGGLYLGFRHQDVYGACGSMSGGVDIRPFPENWNIAKRLGPYNQFPERWEANTVINLTHLLSPNKLAIIFDVGRNDFFYDVNVALHDKLIARNIPHDFTVRPGVHNFEYWENAIAYQMMYFSKFFEKNQK
ncbi:alpha/beta hydrolase [Pedobacter agri]|uniref:Alpha/beta hydrolase-fold protein n=1 Tax=Pedobacter agri TaxID=454586 RepID=A0A9X3DJ45_9SPHI|nr:alpha/beta hydrolase-fold protein [Pedobacter agri]MCX3266088.1 alpha/beta hydrolase-fold protein [Pedobacter agri]